MSAQKFYDGMYRHYQIAGYKMPPAFSLYRYEQFEKEPFAGSENSDVPMGKWLLEHIPKPQRLLDVGCGTGVHTKWFNEQEIKTIGITINPDEIKRRVSENVIYGNMLNMPFKNDSFDCVFILGTLEHTHAPFIVLREANRVLKNNGYLFLDMCSIGGIYLIDKRFYYHKSVLLPLQIKDLLLRTSFKLINGDWEDAIVDRNYVARNSPSYYLSVKRTQNNDATRAFLY